MSYPIATFEPDTPEMYDWHHEELINHMPYTQADMVRQLAAGRFIIEGKQSSLEDAELFADLLTERRKDEPSMWDALDEVANYETVLYGKVF